MNFSSQSVKEKRDRITGRSQKLQYRRRGLLRYCRALLCVAILYVLCWQAGRFVDTIVSSTEKVQREALLSPGDVSVLYDIEGEEIQKISNADSNQSFVSLARIPKCVQQAFVASQDEDFYKHDGMDVQEMARDIIGEIFHIDSGRRSEKTITTQLLDNRLDMGGQEEDSLFMLVRQQYLAISLEREMTKDEILELYLNSINMGKNILGIQAASQYYLNKDVWEVNTSEAAVLAAVAEDPELYEPYAHRSENNSRRKIVLKAMLDTGSLSEKEYQETLGDDVYLQMEEASENGGNAGKSCYVDSVLEQIVQDMKSQLGYTQTQAYNMLYRCGVKIYTCQDTGIQKICDEAIEETEGNREAETSFVLIEQGTGQIKAITGRRSGDHYSAREKRQPGSLFDVLAVYTPALDTVGLSLGTVEDDARYLLPDTLAPINQGSQERYRGLVTLRQAMRQSLNVPAVKTLERVTIQTGYEYLQRYGITTLVEQKPLMNSSGAEKSGESDLQYRLALGKLTEGVTNLEMTAAYSALANQGVYRSPRFYSKVVDSQGNVLLENKSAGKRIMKDTTAWLLTSAMRDRENDLAGNGKKKKIVVSGRYAHSGADSDDWYEGYSPYYTGGICIEGTGRSGSQAKVIWKKIMERVHKVKKISQGSYRRPVNVREVEICGKCGNLAVKGLCDKAEGGSTTQKEYFAEGTQPKKNCTCHVRFLFCEDSGVQASYECPSQKTYTRILLEKKETTETEDTPYTVAENITKELCTVHGKKTTVD